MRQFNQSLVPPVINSSPANFSIDCRLITPMFGGGHTAREIDPLSPISGKAIRGQLRFWWRATQGAKCSSVEELSKREAEIFGRTDRKSPIILRLSDLQFGTCSPIQEWHQTFNKNQNKNEWKVRWKQGLDQISYVLFPFQVEEAIKKKFRDSKDKPSDEVFCRCLPELTFRLSVVLPNELEADVYAAFWAWMTFGGLGSRTRRGLGSIMCNDLRFAPAKDVNVEKWLSECMGKYLVPRSPSRPWQTLTLDSVFIGKAVTTDLAWAKAVQTMSDFRQGLVGRNRGGTTNPGRSHWPEPESIRVLTNYRLNKGIKSSHPVDNTKPNCAFPRAEFGLPIVFHFKDSADNVPTDMDLDPRQTELYPVTNGTRRGRMASPIILKVLATSDSQAVPLIAKLSTPNLDAAELVFERNDTSPICSLAINNLRSSTFLTDPNSPLGPIGKPRSATGSALEAFLSFAQEPSNAFQKVVIP